MGAQSTLLDSLLKLLRGRLLQLVLISSLLPFCTVQGKNMQKNNDASLLTTSRKKRKSQRKEKKREQGRETTRSDNPQSIKVAAIGRAKPSQAKPKLFPSVMHRRVIQYIYRHKPIAFPIDKAVQ